jgi:hypothetical protein
LLKSGKTIFDKQPALSEQVVICIPTNGMMHSLSAFCLTNAIRFTEKQGIPVVLEMDAGTVLSNQRQVLLDSAINTHQADHVMWFDSDMTFPEDVIVRLLEHNKNVVCATYSKRVEPFHATAFYNINPVEPVDVSGHGLAEIKYTGMGCVLMKANVINEIPSPHFPLKWHAPSSSWHGEDMGFCEVLSQNNVKIFCDLDLSREIGHLGTQEFYVK